MRSTVTADEGRAALRELRTRHEAAPPPENEAETRFHLIDKLIRDCLGWPSDAFTLERYREKGFSDYELGVPPAAIWEAKHADDVFEIPVDGDASTVTTIPALLTTSKDIRGSLDQVLGYATTRGIELAVLSNGHQLVAFVASRRDGLPPLDGQALVGRSLRHIEENFGDFWQALSPDGVATRTLARLLLRNKELYIPQKLKHQISQYDRQRYPSRLQSDLRRLSQLLLIEIPDSAQYEADFILNCYAQHGALSKNALIAKNILQTRYSFLEKQTDDHHAGSANEKKSRNNLDSAITDASLANRPIILVGDVGVGKSTFIKHLLYADAKDEFANAYSIYIDLGHRGALGRSVSDVVTDEVEDQLRSRYDIDIREDSFVRAVFHGDLMQFRKGIYGRLRETDPDEYQRKELEYLETLMGNTEKFLSAAIRHIVYGRRTQVIVVIDNADQRDYQTQQNAFLAAQTIAQDWDATAFVSVRPRTFQLSKSGGALSAYPSTVLTVSPPKPEEVIEKRLVFASNILSGEVDVPALKNVDLDLESIGIFLRVLLRSLQKNEEIQEFVANITGGNVRQLVELVADFIGSPNVDANKIVTHGASGGRGYRIPLHEFTKHALLGELSYYHPETSIAFNVYDVYEADSKFHFCTPMILGCLEQNHGIQDKDGFVDVKSLCDCLRNAGLQEEAVRERIGQLVDRKLIEFPERITLAEDGADWLEMDQSRVRVTSLGAYHIRRWAGDFAYLDAMVADTPILDDDVRGEIAGLVESFDIRERYKKTTRFRAYLDKAWDESGLDGRWFDWRTVRDARNETFERVRRAAAL